MDFEVPSNYLSKNRAEQNLIGLKFSIRTKPKKGNESAQIGYEYKSINSDEYISDWHLVLYKPFELSNFTYSNGALSIYIS